MFLSADELSARAAGIPVAIVGAGPAGMSLAMRLAERGVDSLLIEAGGREPVPDADAFRGSVGERPYPLMASRMHGLGGSTGHWGGWCRPLDPVDFEPIEGVPLTGWPISRDEAYTHLARAHELLEIPDARYEGEDVLAAASATGIALPGQDDFGHAVFRFSPPTRFGLRYRSLVHESTRIHCALDCSLVSIDQAEGRTRLHLLDTAGRAITVRAGASVLAMGGIENPRMLLWSNRRHGLALGGAGDWIGRCFVDHFGRLSAEFLLPGVLDYGPRETAAGRLMAKLVPSAERVRRGDSPNHMIELVQSTQEHLLQPEFGQSGLLFGGRAEPRFRYGAVATAGQRPLRDSRILLDDTLDARGVPRARVDWRIDAADFQGVLDSLDLLGRHVAGQGLGRLRRREFHVPAPGEALATGMHHIGTTRMARDEREGVVDRDGRVFGTQDLYVAGSSVFPTSGYANPTLTLVALALRLAEHLADREARA